MSAELVLAAVGAADLCLKYGKHLLKVCQAFKQADEDIQAKTLLIESTWSQMAIQVEFVQRIAHTMSPDHCRIHFEVIEMLQAKLQAAIRKIEPLLGRENAGKAYGIDSELLEKSTMLKDSSYREDQGRTNPSSWSTLVTMQSLRNILKNGSTPGTHVTLPAEGLDWESARKIQYSTTRLIPRMRSNKLYLVDSMLCDSSLDISRARADAEALARKLKQFENNNIGLLSCQGLVKHRTQPEGRLSSIHLVFRLPIGETPPVSLRSELLKRSMVSLSTVIDIARQLAMAVSFVHTCDFVHKNIRPETVLLLTNSDSELAEGRITSVSVQLLGFDRFRSVNFSTMRRGDTAWERNLYRHPLRQGPRVQEDYVMQHDVYSLGVCLLELGLWESFVMDKEDGETYAEDEDLEKTPSSTLGLTVDDFSLDMGLLAEPATRIKDRLVQLARSQLPQRMGNKYIAVVITCLTCLDEGNEDFGDQDDMHDEDGILIGVRFIEKILFKLSEISL